MQGARPPVRPEVVTVISGVFHVGIGESGEIAETTRLEPGSFFAFEPGHVHYAHAEGETVIQLNSTGPWTITYADPANDPRS